MAVPHRVALFQALIGRTDQRCLDACLLMALSTNDY